MSKRKFINVVSSHDADTYLPGRQVDARYDISSCTRWRWEHDKNLNFPKARKIRGRNYYSLRELAEFDAAQAGR